MRPTANATRRLRIGVFDSGLGGLSILQHLHRLRPDADLIYAADSGHAPYGEKPPAQIVERSLRLADFLVHQERSELLVVACNTATAAAVHALRMAHPDLPIVGVEPGIKPAAAVTRNGRVGVLATSSTLQSERFQLLAQAHAAHVELVLQPGWGLAAAIEAHPLDSAEIGDRITRCCAPLRESGVDTVVLGCTHYPLVADRIQATFDAGVQLIDTSAAVARRTLDLRPITDAAGLPQLDFWSSADPEILERTARRWLGLKSAPSRPLPSAWA